MIAVALDPAVVAIGVASRGATASLRFPCLARRCKQGLGGGALRDHGGEFLAVECAWLALSVSPVAHTLRRLRLAATDLMLRVAQLGRRCSPASGA